MHHILLSYQLRIGVTGHRTLHDVSLLNTCLHNILNTAYLEAFTPEAQQTLSTATNTPITFSIISPLAEGADRLVANAVLDHGGSLEALLPLPQEEYEKDFATPESRHEFRSLLAQSYRTTVTECEAAVHDPDYRQKAYLRVGEETVARCDILIALWDGKPSRGVGGTADIVALAIAQGKPVFIISTSQPGMVELRNGGTLQAAG